ncbi:MAG: hypothetical protein IKF41_00105 [Alphaproteobacteria bacterium]|nr:hypothetical protein [Alphaproteobacteria bacterium]
MLKCPKKPTYASKLPNEDHPVVWADLPFAIEKILYMENVTARRSGATKDYDHILIEKTDVDKTSGQKNKKLLFEFIEDIKSERGCIYTGNNQLIYAGHFLCEEDGIADIFNQVFFTVTANHTNSLLREAKEQKKMCPATEPIFNYILPILYEARTR